MCSSGLNITMVYLMKLVTSRIQFIQSATRMIVARNKSLAAQIFQSRIWGKDNPITGTLENEHFTDHFGIAEFSVLPSIDCSDISMWVIKVTKSLTPHEVGSLCALACRIYIVDTCSSDNIFHTRSS